MGSACHISSKPQIIRMTFNFGGRGEDGSRDTTEDTRVQSVVVFNTHRTPLARWKNRPGVKYSDGNIGTRRLKPRCSAELDFDPDFSAKTAFSSNVASSHTVKNYIRESIILEASRFRLEQKTSIWDKYDVVKTLGKGTFGEVRMIKNKHTKARRAVKTISKAHCEAAKNYLEEISILKHLVKFSIAHRTIPMSCVCTSSIKTRRTSTS